MTDKINIEIDGRVCEAAPGEMIIAVADREGISIPRFCYHKKLSIAANCRMCLVEAEAGGRPFPKPVPACATPVSEGMKVQTRSPKAIDAQQGTMEFLLINHPLDCPICDQGGECELQDVALGYGASVSRFSERKRVVEDEDLGPLIATDMTRCIHCTRCVRFGAEIAGVRDLGATGRGETMRIGTFIAQTVTHELSGNVIDLCPVGALTSKPYRFSARAWELTERPSIAPHDGLGSNIALHVLRGRVMRVHPRENEAVNETWIADRDRFSYTGLQAPDRLERPLVKRDGVWHEVEWLEALGLVAERLKAAGADQGWWLAPNATLEELYLAQRIARGLGSANLDYRLRQPDQRRDEADALAPWLGLDLAELESRRAILVVGSDLRQEQPLLAHRIRKAALEGCAVSCINPLRLELHHPARQSVVTLAGMVDALAALARALGCAGTGAAAALIAASTPDETHEAMARELREAGEGAQMLLGALAEAHPDYSLLKALAEAIAEDAGVGLGYLPPAANSVGAALAGARPGVRPGARAVAESGRNLAAMLDAPPANLVLWNLEPEHDLFDPARARAALERADFVVAASAYRTPLLEATANVLLPIGLFAETSGTFVNATGLWQRFQGAVAPPGEARPGWKVLRVLGNLVDLPDFGYQNASEVAAELAAHCAESHLDNRPRTQTDGLERRAEGEMLMRLGGVPIYATDALVRRAEPLRHMPMPRSTFALYLNPEQAQALGLEAGAEARVRQGESEAVLRVELDAHLPMGCAWIPAAVPGSEQLGASQGAIDVAPALRG